MMHISMILDLDPEACMYVWCMYLLCGKLLSQNPAAAPPIENRIKFPDILSLGGAAAAGADKGILGVG